MKAGACAPAWRPGASASGLPLTALGKLHGLTEPLLAVERYLVGPLVAVGYLGAVGLLVDRGALPWLRRRMAEIGRTALSCYVLQNILASILMCRSSERRNACK